MKFQKLKIYCIGKSKYPTINTYPLLVTIEVLEKICSRLYNMKNSPAKLLNSPRDKLSFHKVNFYNDLG